MHTGGGSRMEGGRVTVHSAWKIKGWRVEVEGGRVEGMWVCVGGMEGWVEDGAGVGWRVEAGEDE